MFMEIKLFRQYMHKFAVHCRYKYDESQLSQLSLSG